MMRKVNSSSWLGVVLFHFVLISTLKNESVKTTISAFNFLVSPKQNSFRTRPIVHDKKRVSVCSSCIKHVGASTRRRRNDFVLLSLSLNPNDLESPEERKQRLEWAEQISKSFYRNETGVIIEHATTHTNDNHTVLTNVPLWRVQWTELPGFQNVLNCHVPHYTHMFRKVLYGPKPWYFGHIYLPRGSENLENPNYFLCSSDNTNTTTSRPDAVTHIGTLMKISDYKQLEDGRLMLIVQALNKFRVTRIHQHLPFAVATVELVPDKESIQYYYQQAQQQQQQQMNTKSSKYCLYQAAKEAAVLESLYWEPFEYRNVLISECLQDGGVSPLANYNQTATIEDETPISPKNSNNSWNKTLSNSFQISLEDIDKEEEYLDNAMDDYSVNSLEAVLEVERSVWIQLDYMLQLLTLVNPNPTQTIPIPTQILGLIPVNDDGDDDWPDGFKLHTIAKQMSLNRNQVVGTWSKSPFVLLSSSTVKYPTLRRAQRLSFVIWSILDTLLAGYDPAIQTRQSVLELTSTRERLLAADRGIQAINRALQQVVKK